MRLGRSLVRELAAWSLCVRAPVTTLSPNSSSRTGSHSGIGQSTGDWAEVFPWKSEYSQDSLIPQSLSLSNGSKMVVPAHLHPDLFCYLVMEFFSRYPHFHSFSYGLDDSGLSSDSILTRDFCLIDPCDSEHPRTSSIDLFERVNGLLTRLNEQQVKTVAWQIVSSVDYMHRNGIVHGDLKVSCPCLLLH